jgi:phosphopantetheinyl transferase (holo-ACP synthase)
LQRPVVPLWSATTCAPYPDEADDIRTLFVRHLVEPVRFRGLIEALHARGVRAFVQMGNTALGGFIDDTLRGRDHLAVAASSSKRSGLAQLARVGAALWVEGGHARLDVLDLEISGPVESRGEALVLGAPLIQLESRLPLRSSSSMLPATGDPVLVELQATFDEIAAAQIQVVDAWKRSRVRQPAVLEPGERSWARTMSVENHPELADHTFYRQPAGWDDPTDRFPVVPMTMIVELMADAATELVPGRVAIAIENITAYRWMAVAPPLELEINARFDGIDRVQVRIGDYANGTVVVGTQYPGAPVPDRTRLSDAREPAIDAARMYSDRWMFHGPAYQGVVSLDEIAADGIRGTLASIPARGGLLDCAGQLMGYWVMDAVETDRLAFPARIARIELFAPQPPQSEHLQCTVRVRSMDDSLVHADIELVHGDRVWCRISDWTDKRFDTDEVVWPLLRYPEHNTLSQVRETGFTHCVERWRGLASRELMARRYLSRAEREQMDGLGVRRKRGWLLGRIAAKDAVRDWLWKRGRGSMFPVEVSVSNQADGRPRVSGPFSEDLRISIAHKDTVAVARVAVGRDVGIDIERIEPRSDSFAAIAFTDAERTLRADEDRDEWLTRVWSAKEAAAKARGTGLEGNPRRFEIKEVAGERLLVGSARGGDSLPPRWVETQRDGDYIIAWTCE